eukprot:1175808-Prorocentrum_minimum.AAC.1
MPAAWTSRVRDKGISAPAGATAGASAAMSPVSGAAAPSMDASGASAAASAGPAAAATGPAAAATGPAAGPAAAAAGPAAATAGPCSRHPDSWVTRLHGWLAQARLVPLTSTLVHLTSTLVPLTSTQRYGGLKGGARRRGDGVAGRRNIRNDGAARVWRVAAYVAIELDGDEVHGTRKDRKDVKGRYSSRSASGRIYLTNIDLALEVVPTAYQAALTNIHDSHLLTETLLRKRVWVAPATSSNTASLSGAGATRTSAGAGPGAPLRRSALAEGPGAGATGGARKDQHKLETIGHYEYEHGRTIHEQGGYSG